MRVGPNSVITLINLWLSEFRPDHKTGKSVPCSFQIECGIFNQFIIIVNGNNCLLYTLCYNINYLKTGIIIIIIIIIIIYYYYIVLLVNCSH